MSSWAIKTEADLKRLVRLGVTTESLYLDFKSGLDRGPGAQAELGRDVAQFANTHGGCLLLGVSESKDPVTGIKTAVSVTGVKDPDKDKGDIEQWIRNVLVPADLARTIDFICTEQGVVIAINVQPSRRMIWIADPGAKNHIEAVRRSNHGKEYMHPIEIERHWSNTLRSAQISFHEAYDEARAATPIGTPVPCSILGGVTRTSNHLGGGRPMQLMSGRPVVTRSDSRGFTLTVPIGEDRIPLRIPFELLSTAWVDDNVMHLFFHAPLVFDANAKLLQFDPFDQVRR